MLDYLADSKDHVIGPSLLPLLSIDLRPVLQLLRISYDFLARDTRPNRRKFVKRLGIAELTAGDRGWELKVASGHVVADRVSENEVSPVVFSSVLAVFADDNRELAFVVEITLAILVDWDIVERSGESVAGLHENGRVGGNCKL